MNRIDEPQAAKLRLECVKMAIDTSGAHQLAPGQVEPAEKIIARAAAYAEFVLGEQKAEQRAYLSAAGADVPPEAGSLLTVLRDGVRRVLAAPQMQTVRLDPGEAYLIHADNYLIEISRLRKAKP